MSNIFLYHNQCKGCIKIATILKEYNISELSTINVELDENGDIPSIVKNFMGIGLTKVPAIISGDNEIYQGYDAYMWIINYINNLSSGVNCITQGENSTNIMPQINEIEAFSNIDNKYTSVDKKNSVVPREETRYTKPYKKRKKNIQANLDEIRKQREMELLS